MTIRNLALVDIGSNSVRLVVYDESAPAPRQVYSEKIICGLGKRSPSDGLLDPLRCKKALGALTRFRTICQSLTVSRIFAFATAAIRDATNGADFAEQASAQLGAPVKVISGEQEAYLARRGAKAMLGDIDAVVGDLGGGSLELVCTAPNGPAQTLPIGVLTIRQNALASAKSRRGLCEVLDRHFSNCRPVEAMSERFFVPVGGIWRAIGRVALANADILMPLNYLHLTRKEALQLARAAQRREALSGIETVASARRKHLATGGLILERLLRVGEPRGVVFTTGGAREGLLAHLSDPDETLHVDPLLADVRRLSAQNGIAREEVENHFTFTESCLRGLGLTEKALPSRLIKALSHLHPTFAGLNADLRALGAFNFVLHAELRALSHHDRVRLAAMTAFAFKGTFTSGRVRQTIRKAVGSALSDLRLAGSVIRLAQTIAAGNHKRLASANFTRIDDRQLLLRTHQVDIGADAIARWIAQINKIGRRDLRRLVRLHR